MHDCHVHMCDCHWRPSRLEALNVTHRPGMSFVCNSPPRNVANLHGRVAAVTAAQSRKQVSHHGDLKVKLEDLTAFRGIVAYYQLDISNGLMFTRPFGMQLCRPA
jgi:hypothetical protein